MIDAYLLSIGEIRALVDWIERTAAGQAAFVLVVLAIGALLGPDRDDDN